MVEATFLEVRKFALAFPAYVPYMFWPVPIGSLPAAAGVTGWRGENPDDGNGLIR